MQLGCGCSEVFVWQWGHREACRWAGAAATDYPGVREWQSQLPDGDPDGSVALALHERAALDAAYRLRPGHWVTVDRAYAALTDIPEPRVEATPEQAKA